MLPIQHKQHQLRTIAALDEAAASHFQQALARTRQSSYAAPQGTKAMMKTVRNHVTTEKQACGL